MSWCECDGLPTLESGNYLACVDILAAKNAADASATREPARAPKTQRVNATIYKYTPHELQAAKGTLEWWTTIFSEPSDARRYWNVYSTLVSEPSVPVK